MQFFQTKNFKRLERTWYRKLKDDGFTDLERGHTGTPQQDLEQRVYFRTGVVETVHDYYSWASQAMHTDRFRRGRMPAASSFPGRRFRRAWRLHVEGHSDAEVGRAIGLSRWRASLFLAEIRRHLGG